MSDSVSVCHELMHHINLKRGNLKLMAVKLDLAKAYDKVEWSLLERILSLHGLPPKFIHLIMECVSSSSFSVLINRSPSRFFKPTRGLRQGNPLSTFLFTIYIDLLSRMLVRAEDDNCFQGIKIGRTCPRISHLLYADDITIFCRADDSSAHAIRSILNVYSSWSGQTISWEKSMIHFSKNTSSQFRQRICEQLGMRDVTTNAYI